MLGVFGFLRDWCFGYRVRRSEQALNRVTSNSLGDDHICTKQKRVDIISHYRVQHADVAEISQFRFCFSCSLVRTR